MKFFKPILFGILVAALLFSCVEDTVSTDVSVYTEEVVFASGQRAIMTGRLLAEAAVGVQDHGFQIDTEESFPSPIIVSLGEKDVPGRFVGQTEALNIEVSYYCRAFIQTKGELKTGNIIPFSTLTPFAVDFEPKEGKQNNQVTIEGRNLTDDTRILWNGNEITPNSIVAETFAEINVPAIADDPVIDLAILSQGSTSALNDPFEYIIGEWTEVGQLDDIIKNTRHVFFEDGEEFIYGLGLAQSNLTSAVQILNKNTLQRTTIALPGQAVEGAFYHEGFVGSGSMTRVFNEMMPIDLSGEFFKYENQSFTKLADVPKRLYLAVGLVADEKLYLYGGETEDRQRNFASYIYDIATDTWTLGFESPFSPLSAYPFFHLAGFNYFVLEDGTTWRHDYTNNNWEQMADFPTDVKEYGVSLILDGHAYVGMQDTNRRIYVYRPETNSWRSKNSLPDNNPFNTLGGWINNGEIFIVRNEVSVPTNRVLWKLDPLAF
ncbi:MAG: kelch repeat-containing protein [Bacteroidota bacterium]